VEQLEMKFFETRDSSLIPDADGSAIQETIYLLSVPGMCDSVKDGLAQSPKDLATSLDW
jgi:PHD/YefM family antitoxin component YafN of YafNO toxin-antitoxin module